MRRMILPTRNYHDKTRAIQVLRGGYQGHKHLHVQQQTPLEQQQQEVK